MFWRQKELYTQLQSQREKLILPWKSTLGPSMIHRRNFSLSNSGSTGFNTPKKTPSSLKVHLRKFFSRKSYTIVKNLFCLSFSCLSSLHKKWNQKEGSQNIKKCVRGSVGCWHKIVIFLWPNTSPFQKPFGNRLLVSKSKIDYQ